MLYRDFRDFLRLLDSRGLLVTLKKQLENGYEVSALAWELAEKEGPAVQFQVKGHDIPIIMGIHGTLERNCLALGLQPKLSNREKFYQIRNLMADILESRNKWIKPVTVDKAPCQETVMVGDEVDLFKLPVLKWNTMDGGPYILLTNVITRNMSKGSLERNSGMYRVMVRNKNTVNVMCCSTQDIGIHAAIARQLGLKKMPLAIALGADPVLNILSATKMASFADDEFDCVGGIRGEPVEMVHCRTIDLDVPSNSEIIIEGELDLDPGKASLEGTFAEWMGYYEEPMFLPELHVTAITHRKDLRYVTCIVGHAKNDGEVIRFPVIQANNYNNLKRIVAGFRDFVAPWNTRGYKVVVQVEKRYPGWGMQAALAALNTGQGFAAANIAIAVSEDIDPWDQDRVDWSIATRVDPAKDVIILPPVGVYPLNPAASKRVNNDPVTGYTEYSYIGKMAIDATKKLASENRRPSSIPVLPDEKSLESVRKNWADFGLPDLPIYSK